MRTGSVSSNMRTLARRARGVNVPTLRAAWWAARSVRRLRLGLRTTGLEAQVGMPPRLPSSAVRGVTATAHWMRASCLERSLLLQKWLLAHDRPHTLVIGVPAAGTKPFIAHAWLEGHDRPDDSAAYAQLVRLDPR